MYLIYFDESGDTGTNYADEQQPVFVLGALLLPQDSWKPLEIKFRAIISKAFDGNIPENFELHTMDLVNCRGFFKQMDRVQTQALRNALLELIEKNQLSFVYRKIIKKRFQKHCEQRFGNGIKIEPYIMALPFLCTYIDRHLTQTQELGIQIFDQHRDLSGIEKTIKTLRLDTESNLYTPQFIEKGFFVDSAQSWPIQLVDLVLYYVRKFEEHRIGKKVSEIHQEVFPQITKFAKSLDSHDQQVEIIDWVGLSHGTKKAITPEGGTVN